MPTVPQHVYRFERQTLLEAIPIISMNISRVWKHAGSRTYKNKAWTVGSLYSYVRPLEIEDFAESLSRNGVMFRHRIDASIGSLELDSTRISEILIKDK